MEAKLKELDDKAKQLDDKAKQLDDKAKQLDDKAALLATRQCSPRQVTAASEDGFNASLDCKTIA
jgi:X-X-X-Leu-X-X-Gly heptad repeat protein